MSELIFLSLEDFRIVGFNLGKFSRTLSLLLIPSIAVACACSELEVIPAFLAGLSFAVLFSSLLEHFFYTEREMELKHALLVTALLWLVAPLIGSIPLWLGGGYHSYLDSLFEGASGFTGTGLTVTTRPELLPKSINFFRHLLQFVGDGIGIVVISLCIFGRTHISSFLLFRGETREAGIRPSVVRTSRRIFSIAVTFLALGTVLFTLAGLSAGQKFGESFFDGLNHSMTAYATGGFSTRSQNLLYYHSPVVETVALILMILGSLNFNLHYVAFTGKRGEMLRDIEVRFFLFAALTGLILIALPLSRLYSSPSLLFRKGLFQLLSAQTTTGFQTVPSSFLLLLWPVPVLFLLSLLMIIGGSANSTSGGVKGIRVGILFKSLLLEVRRIFLPSSAVTGERYYHLGENPITETVIRGATLVLLSYLILFGIGTMITAAFGYPLQGAMFESASALSNTGLSCGITSPSMPAALKVTYIFLMWAGRLEIITALVLLASLFFSIRRWIP